jgi:DNA-binding transcriptional ArsR family regulator
MEQVSLQQVLEALGDPIRRSMLLQLAAADDALSCGCFEAPVKLSTMTYHFHALRNAGLIRQHYVGSSKLNTLRIEDMEQRFPGLLTAVIAASATERGSERY